MKKIVIASILAATAFAASAVEVSATHDYVTKRDGVRGGATVAGVDVTATHVDNAYNRYAVGKSFDLFKVGAANVSASVAGVYQDTRYGQNGYGVTAGVKATVPVTKSVDAFVGAERFAGQDRVKSFNGSTAQLGVSYKF